MTAQYSRESSEIILLIQQIIILFQAILGDSTAPKNDDGPIAFVQRTTSVFLF